MSLRIEVKDGDLHTATIGPADDVVTLIKENQIKFTEFLVQSESLKFRFELWSDDNLLLVLGWDQRVSFFDLASQLGIMRPSVFQAFSNDKTT